MLSIIIVRKEIYLWYVFNGCYEELNVIVIVKYNNIS